MIKKQINRRDMLKSSGLLLGAISLTHCSPSKRTASHQFRFCLNTSTIRGHNLDLPEEMKLTAAAGYDGIEIWMRELNVYLEKGGSLEEIKHAAQDLGLTIESAIAFPRWIVNDDAERQQALEQIKVEMDMLRQINCFRIAAPPVGATTGSLDLRAAADRYAAILDIGNEMGVLPQLEVWGFSANVHTIGQAFYIAAESGHTDACLLLDVYHLYRGGSPFNALQLLDGAALHMFHMNDYPEIPPRDQLKDSHRVYPGDGVAPFADIIRFLHAKGKPIVLSLELFNKDLWAQEVGTVLETGLAKMRTVVSDHIS